MKVSVLKTSDVSICIILDLAVPDMGGSAY